MAKSIQHKWVCVKVDSRTLDPKKKYVSHDKARSWCLKNPGHKVMSIEYWADKRNEDVEVINCLSGNTVTIKRHQIGGPCDPSTERYHCM